MQIHPCSTRLSASPVSAARRSFSSRRYMAEATKISVAFPNREKAMKTKDASHALKTDMRPATAHRAYKQDPGGSPLRGGTPGSRGLRTTAMIRAIANTSMSEISYPLVCPRYFSMLSIISVNLPGCSVGMKIISPKSPRCHARREASTMPSTGAKPPYIRRAKMILIRSFKTGNVVLHPALSPPSTAGLLTWEAGFTLPPFFALHLMNPL